MDNMRTLAFQVTEELFQKIKGYLQRNNMTQKQFVIGLIENEIERDLAQRAAEQEQQETAVVSDCNSFSEEVGEQDSAAVSDDFDAENEKAENAHAGEELDKDQEESEEIGFSMGI